jgi:adenylate kinase family enzyme
MTLFLPTPTRILVIGTSSTGKTTYAKQLEKILGIPWIELDELYWGEGWTPSSKEAFVRRVGEAIAQPNWIVDGNYSSVRDLIRSKATLVVWLNYDLPLVLWRGFRRTVGRCISRQALWHGNRESFRQSFCSRNSILLWIVTTHQRRIRDFKALRDSKAFPEARWVEFQRPSEAKQWLQCVQNEVQAIRKAEWRNRA